MNFNIIKVNAKGHEGVPHVKGGRPGQHAVSVKFGENSEPESVASLYGFKVEKNYPESIGGHWRGPDTVVVTNNRRLQKYNAADWTSNEADSDFKSKKEYPENFLTAAHETVHGIFSRNPEAGHKAINEFKKLGIPEHVTFESVVDVGGLYLIEPNSITNSKIKEVMDGWLGGVKVNAGHTGIPHVKGGRPGQHYGSGGSGDFSRDRRVGKGDLVNYVENEGNLIIHNVGWSDEMPKPAERMSDMIKFLSGNEPDSLSDDLAIRYKQKAAERLRKRIIEEGTPEEIQAYKDVFENPNGPFAYMISKGEPEKGIIGAWAHTSADDSKLSLLMQYAAKEEFGLDDVGTGHMRPDQWTVGHAGATMKLAARHVVRSMYNETQDQLKKQGVEEVLLFRGMEITEYENKLPSNIANKVRDTANDLGGDTYGNAKGVVAHESVKMQPMSSFSGSIETAVNFSRGGSFPPGKAHVVIAAKVPRENILSIPSTGYGCMEESEFVVLGKQNPGALLHFSAGLNVAPADYIKRSMIKFLDEESQNTITNNSIKIIKTHTDGHTGVPHVKGGRPGQHAEGSTSNDDLTTKTKEPTKEQLDKASAVFVMMNDTDTPLGKAADSQMRGGVLSKNGRFKDFDEKSKNSNLNKIVSELEKVKKVNPEGYELARQWDLAERFGVKEYSEIPDEVTVWRGHSEKEIPGKVVNVTSKEDVAKKFGSDDIVSEYKVKKDDVVFSLSNSVFNEGELLVKSKSLKKIGERVSDGAKVRISFGKWAEKAVPGQKITSKDGREGALVGVGVGTSMIVNFGKGDGGDYDYAFRWEDMKS